MCLLQRRREECERKARRGEMDPRLEFAFQLLIDATGLSRHEIMDHVFEGDMVTPPKPQNGRIVKEFVARRDQPVVLAPHEEQVDVVLPRHGGNGSGTGGRSV